MIFVPAAEIFRLKLYTTSYASDCRCQMDTDTRYKNTRLLIAIVAGGPAVAFCLIGMLAWFSQPHFLAEVSVGKDCVARLYAEAEFLYEPPGYISIVASTSGGKSVPRYKFMPDNGNRVPNAPFSAAISPSGTVGCVKQFNDVVFMIDFERHIFWPPADWNVVNFAPDAAEAMLGQLNAERDMPFTCNRLTKLKANLARRHK